jgi:hypothetical protein
VPDAHDVAVQLPAHEAPSAAQRLLSQASVVAAVQLPEALHTDAVVALPAEHFAAAQTVALSG